MSTPVLSDAPALIAAHMRAAAARRGVKIGPFTIGLDEHSGDKMRNFAVPDDGATPDHTDISVMIAFFRERGRIPRLEFIEASAPGVTAALLAAGFEVEGRTPVLVSVPGLALTPRAPHGITVREAAGDSDLAAALGVQHIAYEEPSPPGPEDLARLRSVSSRGGVVTVAVDEESGSVAGTGLVDLPGPGSRTGELAAVGVLPEFRRRGIASAVSAHLARTAHARGTSLVFLEAEPGEVSVYRRTGFAGVSAKVWISLP